MKTFKTLLTFFIILNVSALILTGCGDSGGSSSSDTATTINGVASKGLIKGGDVQVFALDSNGNKGSLLGGTTTDSNGAYSVPLGSYTGNVLVEVSGGTYTDEATGDPNQIGVTMRAALADVSGDVSVAVTPMTEIAFKLAGTLTKANIARANSVVSTMIGVNIINTLPAEVITAPGGSTPSTEQLSYGLMLATMSQMVKKGQAADIPTAIQNITNDLSDSRLDATGPALATALNDFLNSNNNKSGINDPAQTPLDDCISTDSNQCIVTPEDTSYIKQAKNMLTKLRTTTLPIYNYDDSGASSLGQNQFQNLSEELQNEIEPELTDTVDRIARVIESATQMADSNQISVTFEKYPDTTLEITVDANTAQFTVTQAGSTIDSGSLSVDDPNHPTDGSLQAEFQTASGDTVSCNLNYQATVDSNNTYTAMTLTGSITSPSFTIDFSQAGRKLSATFAEPPGSSSPDIYPSSIYLDARVTTDIAQMDGLLNISSIIWADDAYNHFNGDCFGGPRPVATSFKGVFEELKKGLPVGVKFTGTITGNWSNAATYVGCLGTSASNFLQWNASFDGTLEEPLRPDLRAFLTVSQSEYQKATMEVNFYQAGDSFLSGTVTYDETSGYVVITISLTNQDGMKVNLTIDESKSDNKQLSGSIETPGGLKIADIYLVDGVPMVKYINGEIDSVI